MLTQSPIEMSPKPRSPGQPLLEIDTVVDSRYAVRRMVGEGGFAEVYEARHVHIDRRVALKVLTLDPRLHHELDGRFMTEARLAARLDHPNVVKIYDFGFIDSPRLPYIAMEYLEGHDVQDDLQRFGPMAPRRAERIVRQALQALACAHDQGIVHKDLKPSNLFIQHAGRSSETLKLVDFGIAGLQAGTEQRRTATGELCGTPAYLAPEYIEGASPTPAMDVYQMALILVELLTGQPVVDGATPYAVLMRHCSGDLTIPVGLLTSSIGPVLRKALRREPERRFQDAGAFLAALDATTGGFVALEGLMSGANWPAIGEPSGAPPLRSSLDELDDDDLDELDGGVLLEALDDDEGMNSSEGAPRPTTTGRDDLEASSPAASLDAPAVDLDVDMGTSPTLLAPVHIRSEPVTTETSLESSVATRSRRTMLLAVAIAALALIGVALYAWQSTDAGEDTARAEAAVPRDAASDPSPTATAPAPIEPTELVASAPAPAAEPDALVAASVTIESEPPTSEVWIDGVLLGVTPLTLSFDDGRAPVWLEVRREGHTSVSVEIVPESRELVDVTLAADPMAEAPAEPSAAPRTDRKSRKSRSAPTPTDTDSPPPTDSANRRRFVVID